MKEEPLFELIKKMKQTEKAYFKKSAVTYRKNTKNNFLLLFELIEKQKTYNEKKLKELVGTKHFAQKKQHLLKKIIDSLKNYYSNDSIKTQIEALIHESRIYFSKSLLKPAEKSIQKAKSLALKTENYQLYLYVLKNEIDILKSKNDLKKISLLINDYNKTVNKVNQLASEHIQLEEVLIKVIHWNNEMEYIRSNQQLKMLDSIFSAIKNISKSVRSKQIHFYTSGIYHYLKGEHDNSLDCFQKQLDLFQNTNWLKEETLDYIKCLANNCLLAIILKKEKAYQLCYDELKTINSEDPLINTILYYYLQLLNIKQLSKQKKYIKAFDKIQQTEEKMVIIEQQFSNKNILQNEMMIMAFTKAEIHLFNKKPKNAIKVINSYLNLHDKSLKSDTYIISRLINIMIQFELENIEYIEYEIESIKKWLKEKKIDFNFEHTFLRYLEKLLFENDQNKLIKINKEILIKIDQFKKDPFEKSACYVFDFEGWIRQKSNNR